MKQTYRCVVYAHFSIGAESQDEAQRIADEVVWRGLDPMSSAECGKVEDPSTEVAVCRVTGEDWEGM